MCIMVPAKMIQFGLKLIWCNLELHFFFFLILNTLCPDICDKPRLSECLN